MNFTKGSLCKCVSNLIHIPLDGFESCFSWTRSNLVGLVPVFALVCKDCVSVISEVSDGPAVLLAVCS